MDTTIGASNDHGKTAIWDELVANGSQTSEEDDKKEAAGGDHDSDCSDSSESEGDGGK